MTVDDEVRGRMVSRRAPLGFFGIGRVSVALGACSGSGDEAATPGAQFESIPATNHLSVLPDERYHARVVRFLREVDALGDEP